MSEHAAVATHGESEESHDFVIVEHGVHHVDASRKQIWRVFFVMLIITVLEFIIALTPGLRRNELHPTGLIPNNAVVAIFLALTVLKAFYIVGYFMHLKMERINMIYTVLLPLLFIMYLITLLVIEGTGSFR